MIEFIKKVIKKYEETVLYLIFGFLTVAVNTVLYLSISLILNDIFANSIAFVLSLIFAYWTNSKFVFKSALSKETFIKFFGMRIGTIFIDNGGLWLMLHQGWNNLLAKCIVNVIIIILNYIFSKFFFFKNKYEKKKERNENE